MRILVFLKTVLDPHPDLCFNSEGSVEQDAPEPLFLLNPADRCAVEESMRLRDQIGGEVVAISLGGEEARLGLQIALGRGVDRAVHLRLQSNERIEGLRKAVILAEEDHCQDFDLILCGEKSLGGGSGVTGPMLAELLGIPSITRVIHLVIQPSGQKLTVERAMEKGDRLRLSCQLPALVTVTAQINSPRYVSFYRWQHASQDRLETRDVSINRDIVMVPDRVECSLPKPRPRKVKAPSASLSAADRMSFLMGGGRPTVAKKEGGLFEGTPEQAAEKIFNYLVEKGF